MFERSEKKIGGSKNRESQLGELQVLLSYQDFLKQKFSFEELTIRFSRINKKVSWIEQINLAVTA